MRLRKWSIGVCAALGLALCLTGCGQSEQKETKNQPTTAAVTASAVTDSKSDAKTLKEAFDGDFKVGVTTTSGYQPGKWGFRFEDILWCGIVRHRSGSFPRNMIRQRGMWIRQR